MKTVDTLVGDIYDLFINGKEDELNEDNVQALGHNIAKIIGERLKGYRDERARGGNPGTLRMSNLGRPDRQIWYDHHYKGALKEELPPATKIKFLFGDVWEQIILFLAKEAGHTVTHEQETVMINGVVGHCDAVIDGVVVDVKSASTHAFQKFKNGTLEDNDSFGYMDQIAGYARALDVPTGGFLAVDKTLGHLTFLPISAEQITARQTEERIEHLKEVVKNEDTIPERCYEDVPDGKSGNRALAVGCSYCPYKFHCWSDSNGGIGLRVFSYSNGPKFLTEVVKEPRVDESTF